MAQRVKLLPVMQETWVRSLGQEDPLAKEMATHSSILAWRIPRMEEPGRLQSTGSQSRTQLSDFTFHFHIGVCVHTGFPGGTSGKESTCQYRRLRFNLWVGKIPWRRKWLPTPLFLPGKFQGLRRLVSYSPWSRKESDMTKVA